MKATTIRLGVTIIRGNDVISTVAGLLTGTLDREVIGMEGTVMTDIEATETETAEINTKEIAIIETGFWDLIIPPVIEAIVMVNIRFDAGFVIKMGGEKTLQKLKLRNNVYVI